MGAWIEIRSCGWMIGKDQSLPTWERGLKSTHQSGNATALLRSLPTWERGLKSTFGSTAAPPPFVAPYMGAWIEISPNIPAASSACCRSLHGSVD